MSDTTAVVTTSSTTSEPLSHSASLAAGDTNGLYSRISDVLSAGIQALTAGAGYVYHDVAAIEADVTKWETDNPALEGILDEGMQYSKGFLTRAATAAGIKTLPSFELVKDDLLSSLKQLAAADSSMKTGAGTGASTSDPAPVVKKPLPKPQPDAGA